MPAPRILFLEPFHGGSHRAFARGLVAHSRCRIELATLPARNWKWRVRAGGIVFASRLASRLARYDLLLASTLHDASSFLTFARAFGGGRADLPPLIVYMHESQLAYPLARGIPLGEETSDEREDRLPLPRRLQGVTPAAGGPKRDWGLLFADLATVAAADLALFNSGHHRDEFFRGARELLALVPDAPPRGVSALLRRKARVVLPGVELADVPEPAPEGPPDPPVLAGHEEAPSPARSRSNTRPARPHPDGPLILWNHRWEFDKNPVEFFSALRAVAEQGGRFRLALLGESARIVPKPFLAARDRFATQLVHYGRIASRRDYVRWLAASDIIVSTSHHENFGISWIEAVAAGAWPLLPRREAYPELLSRRLHAEHLYDGTEDLVARLLTLCRQPSRLAPGRAARSADARRYEWSKRIAAFDDIFTECANGGLRAGRNARAVNRRSIRGNPARRS